MNEGVDESSGVLKRSWERYGWDGIVWGKNGAGAANGIRWDSLLRLSRNWPINPGEWTELVRVNSWI